MIKQDLDDIKASLAEIKKVLGIGRTAPADVVDIRRRAIRDAEDLNRRSKSQKHKSGERTLHGETES